MYEISKPFVHEVGLRVLRPGRHVQGALAEERARHRRHAGQVVQHHEHLDQRAVRVEQRHLDRPGAGHAVAGCAQVDMTLGYIQV